ncbi:hypothetical protein [Streptomyces roseolilacinus]|uniref:Secreted protein n=1 Tax=Streptomyces roseolilacinus TaxID=66904 RepID=A0A918B047_9ACTN|nr:hypothetical protein [Streptomyces roseolilacinus]GGQ09355.1 hypothetical protein GCM10010249_29860 [Streptomyces roseolilacinus]
MRFPRSLVCVFTALAVAGGAAGAARAADDDTTKTDGTVQFHDCNIIENFDQPSRLTTNETVNCSQNITHGDELAQVVDAVKQLFLLRHGNR